MSVFFSCSTVLITGMHGTNSHGVDGNHLNHPEPRERIERIPPNIGATICMKTFFVYRRMHIALYVCTCYAFRNAIRRKLILDAVTICATILDWFPGNWRTYFYER